MLVGGRFIVVVVVVVIVARCRVWAVRFLFRDDADAVFVLFRVLPCLVSLFFFIVCAAAEIDVATREEVRRLGVDFLGPGGDIVTRRCVRCGGLGDGVTCAIPVLFFVPTRVEMFRSSG